MYAFVPVFFYFFNPAPYLGIFSKEEKKNKWSKMCLMLLSAVHWVTLHTFYNACMQEKGSRTLSHTPCHFSMRPINNTNNPASL